MKVHKISGVTVRLGENAAENARLVEMADGRHHWLHLERFPSGHVVVESADPTDEVLREAAALCLSRTKYRSMRGVGVSTTTVGNLRTTDAPGEVEFVSARRVRRLVLNESTA